MAPCFGWASWTARYVPSFVAEQGGVSLDVVWAGGVLRANWVVIASAMLAFALLTSRVTLRRARVFCMTRYGLRRFGR